MSKSDDVADELGGGILIEGERVGRFVVVKDIDGQTYAVAAGSVAAVCETDTGTLMMLPGGKLLHVARPMALVLAWLDGRQGQGTGAAIQAKAPTSVSAGTRLKAQKAEQDA